MNSSGVKVRRILVAEEEPTICRICLQALTQEGLGVDTTILQYYITLVFRGRAVKYKLFP